MLARSHFYADKPAPSALHLHAQHCSRSRRSDLRLRALLHHWTCWENNDHGGCMVSPCPAQGGSGRTALLVPFSWCPRGTVGSNPFLKSMATPCWCWRCSPQSGGQQNTRGKAAQTDCNQEATFGESLASRDCAWMCWLSGAECRLDEWSGQESRCANFSSTTESPAQCVLSHSLNVYWAPTVSQKACL